MWGVGVHGCIMFSKFFYHTGKSEKSQQKPPIRMKTKPFENKWSQGKDRK